MNKTRFKDIFLKKYLPNLTLILVSLLLTAYIFETALKSGIFDNLDSPSPVWIPPAYKEKDHLINERHKIFSSHNFFLFNDIARSKEKRLGHFRIAVLGDSFVWGDGSPYSDIWSRKLEKRIKTRYENIELVNWGVNGWNTEDELLFLEKFGVDFNIDYLIVGFVDNDPDLNRVPRKTITWQNSSMFNVIKKAFPLSFDFISSYINTFLMNYILKDYGYSPWLEGLYTDENLAHYEKLLKRFSIFCKKHEIPLLFVLTPSNHNPEIKIRFEHVKALLKENDINYIDLYPEVYKRLSHMNTRRLWANPANGHPGGELTNLYSDAVLRYMESFLNLKDSLIKKSVAGNRYLPLLQKVEEQKKNSYMKIASINGKGIKNYKNKIVVKSGGVLYIEGECAETGKGKPFDKIYAVIDKKTFPAAQGPAYEINKTIGQQTTFSKVAGTETLFSIYIPAYEITGKESILSIIAFKEGLGSFTFPRHTLSIEVRD